MSTYTPVWMERDERGNIQLRCELGDCGNKDGVYCTKNDVKIDIEAMECNERRQP